MLTIGPARGFYRATLALDAPGALLLGVAALLWIAAGAYAATYQRGAANAGRFAAGWLLALTGCLGVFIAADMAILYLTLAMMTFGASALVFHDESPGARRAAAIYLGLALAGETLVLVAMIQLAALTPDGSLLLRDAAAVLPSAPQRDVIITLLIIGFGLKAGLVPLHVWMPLAHSAAPMPASAVLSGVVVKAGIIGLIRFLPVDSALADWGNVLAIVGMVTALYAVVIGITQAHPKVVLAYSSVSQMGFTVAVIGMGIANADAATPVLAAFYATHHILVKGAMFLLVGVVASTAAMHLRGTLMLAAVLAVGLGGLPFTGGAVAKLAVKGPLGYGWAATVAYASAVGTTLLMLHFLRRVMANCAEDPTAVAAPGLRWPWVATVRGDPRSVGALSRPAARHRRPTSWRRRRCGRLYGPCSSAVRSRGRWHAGARICHASRPATSRWASIAAHASRWARVPLCSARTRCCGSGLLPACPCWRLRSCSALPCSERGGPEPYRAGERQIPGSPRID